MLGDLFKDKPGFQEYVEELLAWVEPYDDENTIIRWEEDQNGLLHPIARTSYPLL